MRKFFRDLGEFLMAVVKQFKWLLGIVALTILRFWKPIFNTDLPNWVFWVLVCVCLFFAFFFAWRSEHAARVYAESFLWTDRERDLLSRAQVLRDEFLNMMYKWPNSPCVASPFSMSWRPKVGTTTLATDVQTTIDWHGRALTFILEAQQIVPGFFPEITPQRPWPSMGPIAINIVFSFNSFEEILTRKQLNFERK